MEKLDCSKTNHVLSYYFKFGNNIGFNCKLLNAVSTNQVLSFSPSLHPPLYPLLSSFLLFPCLPSFPFCKHSLIDCCVVALMTEIWMRLGPCCARMTEGQMHEQLGQLEGKCFYWNNSECSDRTGKTGVAVLWGLCHSSCGFLWHYHSCHSSLVAVSSITKDKKPWLTFWLWRTVTRDREIMNTPTLFQS